MLIGVVDDKMQKRKKGGGSGEGADASSEFKIVTMASNTVNTILEKRAKGEAMALCIAPGI